MDGTAHMPAHLISSDTLNFFFFFFLLNATFSKTDLTSTEVEIFYQL